MRYTKDHRENTYKRIVDVASQRFRKDGIQAVGIAGLMSEAGLTHGGFYSHFKSKEDLAIKAISQALTDTLSVLEGYAEDNNGGLQALISAYLHPVHREAPEKGCAIAAIGPELSRRPKASQQVISGKIEQFFGLIERHLPRTWGAEKRHRTAVSIFSLMVGALQVSRMMRDGKQRDAVLKDGIEAALALAEISPKG
jgi:TetR/AcrR family transcriptional repressor of nem operon